MRIRINSFPLDQVKDPQQREFLKKQLVQFTSGDHRAALATIDAEFDFAHLERMLFKKNRFSGLDLDVEFPDHEFLTGSFDDRSCGIPEEFYFFRDSTIHTGCLESLGTYRGHWTIFRDLRENVLRIGFVIGDRRYTLLPTEVQKNVNGDNKVIHLIIDSAATICDRRDPQFSDKKKAIHSTKSEHAERFLERASIVLASAAAPISIVVGYTQEVRDAWSEDQINDLLSICETDIAQSLINSGINLGLPSDGQISFSIRPTLVDTDADQKSSANPAIELSAEELAPELVKPDGRFSKLHTERNGANLVFLLVQKPPFQGQGWSINEFAVVPIDHIRWGMFHHELGHMVCHFGGSTNAHLEGFSLPVDAPCPWSSIMDNSGLATKLNVWSTQTLQGFGTLTQTGSKNCARLFPNAAVQMRLLG